MEEQEVDVLIIGAGIAGLTAAKLAKMAGKKTLVIEASDGIGGRVRTDDKDGFLLDRGFQVLLTAYPEAKKLLDYKKLDLKAFRPGAIVLSRHSKHQIGDPIRQPMLLFSTLFSPVGTLADKLLLLKLKIALAFTTVEKIFDRPEMDTMAYLQRYGFSKKFIDNFFRPFFTGIFLENELSTSSRMFEFTFKMFGQGLAAVPAGGMGMISAQLAEGLEKDELILNERVTGIDGNAVHTKSGNSYTARAIIIATDAPHIPVSAFSKNAIERKSALTLYFNTGKKTAATQLIALNSNREQLVNNIAFMDHISPAYAPKDQSLISVSVSTGEGLGVQELEQKVRQELLQWYPESSKWQLLQVYAIPYALPKNDTVSHTVSPNTAQLSANSFICGDHLLNGSINAAMKSAEIAVSAMLASSIFNQQKS